MAILKDLIVHGSSRFLNKIYASEIQTPLIEAEAGIIKKLKADDVTVVGLLDVKGQLHTNSWSNSNIATIDGSFYITPTIGSDSGTVSITSSSLTFSGTNYAISSLYLGDGSSITWPQYSKVLVTGQVLLNGEWIPLGTLLGQISGAATAASISINNIKDNKNQTSNVYTTLVNSGVSNTDYRNLKISLYQRAAGSTTFYPLGIYMTASGTNGRTFLDIYGGVEALSTSNNYGGFAEPNVRIGNLQGLPNVGGQTPSGWGIYTDNGYFKGIIAADRGYIGTGSKYWVIANYEDGSNPNNSRSYIYNNTDSMSSTEEGIYLGTDGIRNYKDSTHFVTIQNGVINAKGVNLTGQINATAGNIGGASITGGTLTVPAAYISGQLTAATIDASKISTGDISSDRITTNVLTALQAKLTSLNTNNLSAITANLGTITTGVIKHDTIGGTNGIWLSADTDTNSNITVGESTARKDWRLLVNNKFGVTKTGDLYASSANISGTITATDGTIGGINIINGALDVSSISIGSLNGANNYAQKIDVTQAIDNIEIGGRNLLKDSNTSTYISKNSAIAHLENGADNVPLQSFVVDIEPVQSGSGDPSPSNIRPISGWDAVNVTRSGESALKPSTAFTETKNGLTFTSDGNGVYHIKGKNTSSSAVQSTIFQVPEFVIPLSETHSLYLNNNQADSGIAIRFMNGSTVIDSWTFGTVNRISTQYAAMGGKTCNGIQINVTTSAQPVDMTFIPMLIAKADIGTYNISLSSAGTIYGGTLNPLTGVLTAYPYYASYNGETLTGRWVSDRDKYVAGTTPTIGAQVVDMSGTGTEIQLTPQQIRSLYGQNNIWADTGNVTVNYKTNELIGNASQVIPSGTTITISTQVDANDIIWDTSAAHKRIGVSLSLSKDGGGTQYIEAWASSSDENCIGIVERFNTSFHGRIKYTYTLLGDIVLNRPANLYIQGISSGTVTVSNPKIEIGNKGTDWTLALEDTQESINNAAKTATSYITYIDANDGIKIHNAQDTLNYLQLNSTAISMYRENEDGLRSDEVLRIDNTGIRIGKNESPHFSLMNDKLIGYSSNNDIYFEVGTNEGTIIQQFYGDGTRTSFQIGPYVLDGSIEYVKKNNNILTENTNYTIDKASTVYDIIFKTKPDLDTPITIRYKSIYYTQTYSIGSSSTSDVIIETVTAFGGGTGTQVTIKSNNNYQIKRIQILQTSAGESYWTTTTEYTRSLESNYYIYEFWTDTLSSGDTVRLQYLISENPGATPSIVAETRTWDSLNEKNGYLSISETTQIVSVSINNNTLILDNNYKVEGPLSFCYLTFPSEQIPASGDKIEIKFKTRGYNSFYHSTYFNFSNKNEEDSVRGMNAASFGSMNINKGAFCLVEGVGNTAVGYATHVEGVNNIASGSHAHAQGQETLASGTNSFSAGVETIASGIGSHAEGYKTIANNSFTYAGGYGTIANSPWQHVVGKYNLKDTQQRYAFIVGNGTGDDNNTIIRSNAFAVEWSGTIRGIGGRRFFTTRTFSQGTTINANSEYHKNYNMPLEGYYGLGIIGFGVYDTANGGKNATWCVFPRCYLWAGSTPLLDLYVWNQHPSQQAIVTVYAKVLYVSTQIFEG